MKNMPFFKRFLENPDAGATPAIRCFNFCTWWSIVLSLVLSFVLTLDLPSALGCVLSKVELTIFSFFTLEYFIRIAFGDFDDKHKSPRLRYFLTWGVIDLCVITAYWLPMACSWWPLSVLRVFRILRMLRLVKLQRYGVTYREIVSTLTRRRTDLFYSALYLIFVLLVSSLLMFVAEHDVQPKEFPNAFSGLWWAVTTFTTVGYGDICPVTCFGRIMGACIGVVGICTLAIFTGIITAGFIGLATTDDLKKQGVGLSAKDREQDERLNELTRRLEDFSKASIAAQCQEVGRLIREKTEGLTIPNEFRQEVFHLSESLREQGEIIRSLSLQMSEIVSRLKDEGAKRSRVGDVVSASVSKILSAFHYKGE